ncbi:hypothetical protein [Actinophytocola sp. NPDC049390]|uniref:hypothetical protein n=1 Tax=Actinophytocola sp. NPDC049390 TaxID=3363894 RepID=UPI0037982921
MNRRAVVTGLLIALLAVFATATSAHHEPGTLAPHTVATTAAPTLPAPLTTPELPLAGAETAEPPPLAPRQAPVAAEPEPLPRADRRPATDRAPPARA